MYSQRPIKIKTEEIDYSCPSRPVIKPLIKIKKEEPTEHENLEQKQETTNQHELKREQQETTNQHEQKQEQQETTNQQENGENQRKKGQSKTASFKPPKHEESRRVPKQSNVRPVVAENRQKLSQLLHYLARDHDWKNASGVLSVLLAGTPTGTSLPEDRRIFLIGAEILKRFGDKSRYETQMKKLFEVWMAKLNWLKRSSDKKAMVMLELALFYLSEGSIQEAYNLTNLLVQDKRLIKTAPTVMLLHGMISYHIWYTTNIPEEMQIKDLDIYIQSEIKIPISNNLGESESALQSSNYHNALDIDDPGFVSDSSVCNTNGNLMNGNENPRKKMRVFGKRKTGFYANESHLDSERENNPSLANLENTSIFLARGLDVNLLPIRLKLMHEDLRESIESYRSLVNEMYNCAVQNLRGALHSDPPLISALLPLIQLLLLGDRVKEAADELEKSCLVFDSPLPFRLRAKLMESFAKGQTNVISSCCEEVLKRDPTCVSSITTLIKLHKNGDYNTTNLLEMLASHIDTVEGTPITWENLALCFLNLINANTSNYEDNVSINTRRVLSGSMLPPKRIPEPFCDARTRSTWGVRNRWWINTHFSNKILLSETEIGDHKLLTRKAACACHIYGPEFEYVTTVHEILLRQGLNDEISFLRVHMKNPLSEFLNLDSC